jgi:xylulokinase
MAVIGIDIGTQSLKAIAVDGDLKPSGEASVAYQPSFPRPGWAEQDPALWLSALRPAIGQALDAANMTADDVKAIGVTGQLDGCVPVDGGGKPLAPCIIWMDRRATDESAAVSSTLVRVRAGLVCDATHMAAKITWVRRHVPLTASVATWHQPVSFVVAALCGRAVMDHALASTTMLYGLAERGYANDLLAAFGIDRRRLPEIDDATAQAGTLTDRGAELTGLRPRTPVAVGTGDDFANAIGSGVVEPGIVSCNIGTGEAIGAVSDQPLIDAKGLVETHGYVGGRFFISNPGWLSGGAVAWFLETFGVEHPEALAEMVADVPPGCDGLLFLPALSGAMAPRWVAGARGAFYGLTTNHGRAACGRALFEGCAFAMRDVVDRLAAMSVRTDRIRLTGGGAQNHIWAQIRADVAQRPVEYGPAHDAAPLGAAILGAVAGGLVASVTEAAKAIVGGYRTCEPDPARIPIYQDAHASYRRLFEALTPMFAEERSVGQAACHRTRAQTA